MLPHHTLPPATSQSTLHAEGKALRAELPRRQHAELGLPAGRDPLAIIDATHVGRVPELIGVRTYRMSQSAFAYYRATADVMAADLASGPRTSIHLVICGDAHISNFGLYASPERRLLFDLNDFDEAAEGPWEWDIKRMCVSLVLVLREKGCTAKEQHRAVREAVLAYQEALSGFMAQSALARFYASVEADWLLKTTRDAQLAQSVKKARRNTSQRVLDKIATRHGSSGCRIVDAPPILVHDRSLYPEQVQAMFAEYLATLAADRALLMSQMHMLDIARRVVGVGSVGTRCGIALLQDPGGHTLFMQYKETNDSVIERWGRLHENVPGKPVAKSASKAVKTAKATQNAKTTAQPRKHNGQRVVARQQILQAVSDPLLGWNVGADDGRDYYWRQFRDMKGSLDLTLFSPEQASRYTQLCARLLARAHAQSPSAAAVVGYLGESGKPRFAEAIADWSLAYADVVKADYQSFMTALAGKRYPLTPEEN